ncbi:MAG TPA: 30S ribosomal protein S3 [bacterium]|nr:30S ribosomal protein S3 [bacterium]HMW32386.1 30S ribosomal protein S3 [bacterium]HMW37251.1 30S ribosomal protein S3 [bacterium]HMY35868.1 30S ribosomal protein S3 [bacterium]HMZ04453.1 30S ribosomal protein S3 [bacterium]
MGQKTNPTGFRLGVIKTWNSSWFDEKNFADKLQEDLTLRNYLRKRLPKDARVTKIAIDRIKKETEVITITIHTARPGIVIGRKGKDVDQLREELKKITGKEIRLNISEIKVPEVDSYLVAADIARQIESQIPYRRAMKNATRAAMRMGAEGIRVAMSGRLGGAEMARADRYAEGRVPLHTLRADIDFAYGTAQTTYGQIGVKVWICKGEVLDTMETK